MADKKISQLTAASTPLAGTEVLPIVQSSATVKVAVSNLTAGRDVNASSFQVGTRLKMFSTYIADAASPTGNNTGRAFSNRIYPCDSAGTLTNNTLALGSGSYQFSTIYTGDNVVVGTAAKGINFTANTPAAGMTSQLLNWYEEGTWTPTQGANLTVVGSYSSVGYYTRIGRQVTLYGSVSGSTSVAIGAASEFVKGIPFTPAISTSGSMNSTDGTKAGTIYMGGSSINSASSIAATTSISFTITYFV